MAYIDMDNPFTYETLHSAVAANTAAPGASTDVLNLGLTNTLRCAVSFAAGMNAAALQLWHHSAGTWTKGEKRTLTPADGSQTEDFLVGARSRLHVQIVDVAQSATPGSVSVTATATIK